MARSESPSGPRTGGVAWTGSSPEQMATTTRRQKSLTAGNGVNPPTRRRSPRAGSEQRSERQHRAPVRRHHRRWPGPGLVHIAGPVRHAEPEGAAMQLATKMGMQPAMVVHAKGMGPDYTFFVVYGRVSHLVDLSEVEVVEREFPLLSSA